MTKDAIISIRVNEKSWPSCQQEVNCTPDEKSSDENFLVEVSPTTASLAVSL